eukprot:1892680-Pleurochrysis_carterae.AAC.2
MIARKRRNANRPKERQRSLPERELAAIARKWRRDQSQKAETPNCQKNRKAHRRKRRSNARKAVGSKVIDEHAVKSEDGC